MLTQPALQASGLMAVRSQSGHPTFLSSPQGKETLSSGLCSQEESIPTNLVLWTNTPSNGQGKGAQGPDWKTPVERTVNKDRETGHQCTFKTPTTLQSELCSFGVGRAGHEDPGLIFSHLKGGNTSSPSEK